MWNLLQSTSVHSECNNPFSTKVKWKTGDWDIVVHFSLIQNKTKLQEMPDSIKYWNKSCSKGSYLLFQKKKGINFIHVCYWIQA